MSKQNTINLQFLTENDLLKICPLQSTNRFISYCKDRGIETTAKQLEQFEKLGIFCPVARVKYPKYKVKVEYIDYGRYKQLGILKDNENWSGDVIEKYESFFFDKSQAIDWLKEGFLWEPSSQSFQSWETFRDENKRNEIDSFYSIFQCYTLYQLIRATEMKLGTEWWISYTHSEIEKWIKKISDWSQKRITNIQECGIRGEPLIGLCQAISNRYFPETQSDRRQIHVSLYSEWDWYEYCYSWDAKSIITEMEIDIDEIKRLHEMVSIDANDVNPLEHWYGLVSFISVEQKKKLKGEALLAQTLYSMEYMLRLFYEDLTSEKLHPPDESYDWTKDKFYGNGINENELKYLEFLTNQFHLNPRPKLILVVEGNSEEEQIPKLIQELFRYSIHKLGVEIINTHGVDNFTGKKGTYSNWAKFIDYYHAKQTIVFVILDNEGHVTQMKNTLLNTDSERCPNRRITKDEYISVWSKNIEFDNFTHNEIAQAMTELSDSQYVFDSQEIAECEAKFGKYGEGDPLGKIYHDKCCENWSKQELLGKLFDIIISNSDEELNRDEKNRRPIVNLLQKVIELAAMNHQPITLEDWEENQKSGYFGDIIE